MTLSPRALRALDILQNNGKFVYQLELNPFTNRRQFVATLFDCYNSRVKGYSFNVLEELKPSGKIVATSIGDARTEYKVAI
jgi:hypothetical protein